MILRYRNKIEKEIAEDFDRKWNKDYSLKIPDDKIRKAIASNIKLQKETRRKAYKSSGTPSNRFSSDPYVSTHGVIWDVSDDSTKQGFIGTDTNFEGFGGGGSFGGGGASGSWDDSSSSSSSFSSDWSSSSSSSDYSSSSDSSSSFGD